MTPVDASNNPDRVKYSFSFKILIFEDVDYVRNSNKRKISAKKYTSNCNREIVKKSIVKKFKITTINIKIREYQS